MTHLDTKVLENGNTLQIHRHGRAMKQKELYQEERRLLEMITIFLSELTLKQLPLMDGFMSKTIIK